MPVTETLAAVVIVVIVLVIVLFGLMQIFSKKVAVVWTLIGRETVEFHEMVLHGVHYYQAAGPAACDDPPKNVINAVARALGHGEAKGVVTNGTDRYTWIVHQRT